MIYIATFGEAAALVKGYIKLTEVDSESPGRQEFWAKIPDNTSLKRATCDSAPRVDFRIISLIPINSGFETP